MWLVTLAALLAAHWLRPATSIRVDPAVIKDEVSGRQFMDDLDEEGVIIYNQHSLANWNYATNITDHNKKLKLKSTSALGNFKRARWQQVQKWKDVFPTFQDPILRRRFEQYMVIGDAALPKHKYDKLTELVTEMGEIYSTGKICDFHNPSKCDLPLDPDIKNILKESRNHEELLHVWKSWRDVVGKPMKRLYEKFVPLSNEAARLNGYLKTSELWINYYESDTFEEDVSDLFFELRPLYEQLHAYVRRKLRNIYGEDIISKKAPIPAHLLGNMWAQNWQSLWKDLMPYPNQPEVDVTATMKQQNYDAKKMFEVADDFFASLNLSRVPTSFWENSMIERPDGREVVCHASAWDFSLGSDFRIKQCTKIEMQDFGTVHHELGHIQYYIQYQHLPLSLRQGANPGFHEAVGDLMSLSVLTPKHLQKVGLLAQVTNNYESDINALLKTALRSVAFLPFGYLVDKWRWDVFREHIPPEEYTCQWWNLRYKYQGIKPPIPRDVEHFDPGAKFHVPHNYQYMAYFVAFVLQFQFHKELCLIAREYEPENHLKPLHQCDIYQSTKAGNKFRELLRKGKSEHWGKQLEFLTGSDKMDVSALREYFKPLEDWLKSDNKRHDEFVGWEGEGDFCESLNFSGSTSFTGPSSTVIITYLLTTFIVKIIV